MSRERKFTEGPWLVNPLVAQVDAMPSTIPVCRMLWPTEDRTEAETEANANLIAAAPDLLEALEMIMDENPASFMTFHEAMAKAATAIKKAYGETE